MIEGEPIYIGFYDEGKRIHQIISGEQLPGGTVHQHGYDVNYSRTYDCHLVYNSGDTSILQLDSWPYSVGALAYLARVAGGELTASDKQEGGNE